MVQRSAHQCSDLRVIATESWRCANRWWDETWYSIAAMSWDAVELEPEVEKWLESLPTAQFAHAAFYVDLLAAHGTLLGEPYTKQLDRKLRELRFHLERRSVRITYWIATDRRIILLTVFHKTRMRDEREIDRARRALARCIDEAHEVVDEEAGS
jgi:hypothetical protein